MKTLRLFLTLQLIFASLAFASCSKDKDGAETNKRIDYTDGSIEKSGGLNLNRIIVLTGSLTANLGEWLIAGLQPYIDVVLIGSKTDGTNAYGTSTWTLPDKKQTLSLVTSLVENSAGKNTLGGLTPAHSVADGLDRDWGDREESLLKAALKFAETGQTKSNLTRAALQSRLPVVREYAPAEALPLPKEVFPVADAK
ncbi:MAG: hypothetical protein LBD35_01200 [Prevotellaceae bacterium]|jgi:hypothetical protein|nr:hypothetical protein [Prevotellaceae bacterium]